jgi:hypothetical protein
MGATCNESREGIAATSFSKEKDGHFVMIVYHLLAKMQRINHVFCSSHALSLQSHHASA